MIAQTVLVLTIQAVAVGALWIVSNHRRRCFERHRARQIKDWCALVSQIKTRKS